MAVTPLLWVCVTSLKISTPCFRNGKLSRQWISLVCVAVFLVCMTVFKFLPWQWVNHCPLLDKVSLVPPRRPDGKLVRPKIIVDYYQYASFHHEDIFVDNCLVTQNQAMVPVADAVAITWRKRHSPFSALPTVRFFWQRWVWVMDESPFHKGQDLTLVDGLFNWTMTYRAQSDIHIPYGSFEKLEKSGEIPPHIGSQKKLICGVISNNYRQIVHNARYDLVSALKKYIPVTIYGQMGEPCEGYNTWTMQTTQVCPFIKDYLFYMSFENSNCKEYFTEKVFLNAFSMGVVPVVFGASKLDYLKALPPHSFIHVRDFESVENLAKYLLFLAGNSTEYLKYHQWRKHYRTNHRIQYIDTSIWGPLCQALNKDDGTEKTWQLSNWWNVKDCEADTSLYRHVHSEQLHLKD